MSRVKMSKGKQKEFFNDVRKISHLTWEQLGQLCGFCGRTVRDWRREKYQMSYEALQKLQEVSGIPIPENIKLLPEYWWIKRASRLGGKAYVRLYGSPGTPEGRRKGGDKIRKHVILPSKSPKLAEFVGIMLGDGGIYSKQLAITLGANEDEAYTEFVTRLTRKVFNIWPSVRKRKKKNVRVIVISRLDVIEYLTSLGLKRGNKVRQQVDIPQWIWENKAFQVSCLRGLMDTDGSFYIYKHKVNGRIYENCALCFTNYSVSLLASTKRILEKLGFSPVMARKRLYLYKRNEIERYFKEIGTNNPKHLQKYKDFVVVKNSFSSLEVSHSG